MLFSFWAVITNIFSRNYLHMKTFIAILRGINVSGKKKIRMKDLAEVLTSSGLRNVKTYIQSGNIIFEHQEKPASYFENLIHKVILDEFGYRVPVIVMSREYLNRVVAENPFLSRKDVDINTLHVTFLSEYPDKANTHLPLEVSYPPDELLPGDRAFYVLCPKGYGRTKFNNDFFEKKTKVAATTRNWKTCNKLLDMAG